MSIFKPKKYAADTAYFIKALNTVFTAIPPAVPSAKLALAPLAADYPFRAARRAGIIAAFNLLHVFEAFQQLPATVKAFDRADVPREVSAFYVYCFAVNQAVSYFLAGRNKYALECWARYLHLFRTLFLLKAFKVFKANGFNLFYLQYVFRNRIHFRLGRDKKLHGGNIFNLSPFHRPCQSLSAPFPSAALLQKLTAAILILSLIKYVNLILGICQCEFASLFHFVTKLIFYPACTAASCFFTVMR